MNKIILVTSLHQLREHHAAGAAQAVIIEKYLGR